jgi:hypothetical protein
MKAPVGAAVFQKKEDLRHDHKNRLIPQPAQCPPQISGAVPGLGLGKAEVTQGWATPLRPLKSVITAHPRKTICMQVGVKILCTSMVLSCGDRDAPRAKHGTNS